MTDLTEFFETAVEPTPLVLRPEILLSPNLPKPLHGLNPRTIMGASWWNEVRHEAYDSTDQHCIACGIPRNAEGMLFAGWLEAHEIYEIDYSNKRAVFKEIVPLCKACHVGIHTGRLTALYGNIYDEEDCWLVFERKKQVCGTYGVVDDRKYAITWSQWRLEFNGKEYKPVHETMDDWREFYGRKNTNTR